MKSRYLAVAFAILLSFLFDDVTLAKKSSKRSGSSEKQTSSKKKSSSKRSGSSKKSTKKKSSESSSKRSGSSKKSTKKKSSESSSKRSGSSKKNTKKTSSGSSKRSASSQSGLKSKASTKRAASTNIRRASATARRNAVSARVATTATDNTVNTETKTVSLENQCPVGKLLRKSVDESGNDVYYKTKTGTCNPPVNSTEVAWNMADASKLKQYTTKKSWISEDEAVAFECESGNLLYKSSCQSFDEFCPLNEIIEKTKDKKYINPNTGNTCTVIGNVKVSKVSASENDSDIENGSAYRLTCPENFYTNTDNYVQCSACPSDKPYSKMGNNIGVKSCSSVSSAECAEGTWQGNGETACKPYDSYEFSDLAIQDNGTLGYGLYSIVSSDETKCKAGTKNPQFSVKSDGAVKFAKVSADTGSYFAVDGEFVKTCTGNVKFTLKQANGSEGLK